MATRKIVLVRHGEYDWDESPGPHKGMTPRGVEQAHLTARRLSSLAASAIYSSDLMRAIETAEMIRNGRDGVPYEQDLELRECCPAGPAYRNVPVEVIDAGQRQAESVFDRYFLPSNEDRHDIIVSHGNMIRYLTARALGNANSWFRMRTSNCGITELDIESDGRMWVVSYNDVGHLPAHLITAGLPSGAHSAAAGPSVNPVSPKV